MAVLTRTFSVTLPQSLWRAKQVREHEEAAAKAAGLTLYELMERAGSAAFDYLQHRWPDCRKLLVLCGYGNNGGDGYVVARLARQAGLAVQLVQVGDAGKLTGCAARARDRWLAAEGEIETPQWLDLSADLIVDGLLGTGVSGPARSPFSEIISRINKSRLPVLSIDIPSGLEPDSGRCHGEVVRASATVTFVGIKQGLCTGDAVLCRGDLIFAGLGIESQFAELVKTDLIRIDYGYLQHLLPPRLGNSHKGKFGHALLLGGNRGMAGAIRLCGEACLRTGAGLVSVGCREENLQLVAAGRPELMVHGVADKWNDAPVSARLVEAATVLAIGPGLGLDEWANRLLAWALESPLPMVIDADGLNLLAQSPLFCDNWILTPHPGEAARLLRCSVAEVEADRFSAVRQLQQRYGGVVVLKGWGSFIYNGEQLCVANVGNPGMASGGMGDLLTGIITGLLAQGLTLMEAATLGVCIHGEAGDAAARQGMRGMVASDLFGAIRTLVNPLVN